MKKSTYPLIGLTFFSLIIWYAMPLRDGDIWWHMLYGEYFLQNKTLIADHTLFSWTPAENSLIYCTWLPDIFFYLLYDRFSLSGLFVFRYLCMLFPVVALWRFARLQNVDGIPLAWFLCLLVVIMSKAAAYSKPEIFSFILMTATIWNWWHIRARGEHAVMNCYLFPLFLLIWINSHGGIIFGIAFLGTVGFGELLNGWCSRNPLPSRVRRHLAFSLLLSILALTITPYGWRYIYQLILFIIPTSEQLAYIKGNSAYTSPFAQSTLSLHYGQYAIILSLLTLILAVCDRKKRIEFSFLLSNFLFAFLFTRYLRTTFYWPLVFSFSAIYLIPSISTCRVPRYFRQIGIAALLAAGFFFSGRVAYESKCNPQDRLWIGFGICEFHPVEAAEFIKKNLPGLRLGNTFGQGAYLLWHLRPPGGVFIDSRQFPYRAWYQDYYRAVSGAGTAELVDKYHADVWCIDISHLAMASWFHRSQDWNLVFYGKNSAIFTRTGVWDKKQNAASPDIDGFKSLSTGLYLINFALMIEDWQTVRKVITRLNSLGICPKAKELGQHAELLLRALQDYQAGNFQHAIQSLEQLGSESAFDVSPLLAFCLIHSSANALQQDAADAAWRLARKAWEIYPENPLTVYNAGVTAWYSENKKNRDRREQKEHFSPAHEKDKTEPDSWKPFLEAFLRNRAVQPDYEAYYMIAETILAGQFSGLPPLFLPPR